MNDALALLVLLWAVLLVPSALRSRTSSRTSIGRFERAMDALRTSSSEAGREVLVPDDAVRIVANGPSARFASSIPTGGLSERGPSDRDLPRRGLAGLDPADDPVAVVHIEDPRIVVRRAWFLRLLLGTAVSLIAAVVAGGIVWFVPAASAVTTIVYAVVLRRAKLRRDAVRSVLRRLSHDVPSVTSTFEETDVAVGGGFSGGPSSAVRLRHWDG